LIRQIGEDAEIDRVLGKALSVLGHAERFKPVDSAYCWAIAASYICAAKIETNAAENRVLSRDGWCRRR
jgi:hypothetical protein